jgi:leucyl-tRNA synthetase
MVGPDERGSARRRWPPTPRREGFGKAAITFRIKDWGISRQRYWGTPIPVIHCPAMRRGAGARRSAARCCCRERIEITGKGRSPLENVPEFVNVKCPAKCGGAARRETDTMDTFVDSSWYFYRYCDPHNDRRRSTRRRSPTGSRSTSTSAAWSTPFCT